MNSLKLHPDFETPDPLPRQRRTAAISTLTVYDFADLSRHIGGWDRLAWLAPQMLPTLLPGWVDAFLRNCLKAGERWCCTFAYAGDELIGVLPAVIAPHWLLGPDRPLLRTPFDDHTPSGDILLAPGCADLALSAMLAQIGKEIPGYLGIEFKQVRSNSPLLASLHGGTAGHVARITSRSRGSLVGLDGTFDEYLARLGNMRRNLKRARKKLEEKGAVSIEIRRGPAAGDEFFADFLAVEASGWKGRNGTAIANDPGTTAFYAALVRNLRAQGRLEWHVLRVNEQLVAAGMGVRCGPSLMLPKIGFDERFADANPGSVLTGEVVKSAFEHPDIREINHMSDENWHRLWHMDQDDYLDVNLIRKGAAPFVFHRSSVLAKVALKTWVRPELLVAARDAFQRLGVPRRNSPGA